jgi:hypothetical protein
VRPNRLVITAGSDDWYASRLSNWRGKFPHPLIDTTIEVLEQSTGEAIHRYVTGELGNLIFRYSGNWTPSGEAQFIDRPDAANFADVLDAEWSTL